MIRIAPVFLLKNGQLIRSTSFKQHRAFGDPFQQARRFSAWQIDELFYIDISTDSAIPSGRRDRIRYETSGLLDLINYVAQDSLVPLTWGGNIRSYADARDRISAGADRVLVTTMLADDPSQVRRFADDFGTQAICAGIDFRNAHGEFGIFVERGSKLVSKNLQEWIRHAIDCGAGEILLHAIDRDGTSAGYDLAILEEALKFVDVPLTILGGARTADHLVEGALAGASCVAAANMWHFTDNVDALVRARFKECGLKVRRV